MILAEKITEERKKNGWSQEEMAEKLSVSRQAVSKWENDISCPDIMLLPKLADIFEVTVDELLSREEKKQIQILPEEKRKSIDDMMFRIYVNSAKGDKVRVNLPLPLIKMGIEMGMSMPEVSGNDALKNIDFLQLISLVEKGVIGRLVEVETADGDIVEVVVE